MTKRVRNYIIGAIVSLVVICGVCGIFASQDNNGTAIDTAQNNVIAVPTDTSAPRESTDTPAPENTPVPTATIQEVFNSPSEAPTSMPIFEGDVIFELAINNGPENRPILMGNTNLPNETIIMTSISNDVIGFLAQQEVVVNDGKFEAGPFGPEIGLEPGNYVASATMPIPSRQPDSVRAIIGENGENLSGNLVQQGDFGITVSTETSLQIGTDSEVNENNEQVIQEASTIFQELQVLLENGQSMETLRHSNDNAVLEQCGNQMRENQAKAEELQSRAETLPQRYLLLKAATVEILRCVSCSENALEYCNITASSIEEISNLFE